MTAAKIVSPSLSPSLTHTQLSKKVKIGSLLFDFFFFLASQFSSNGILRTIPRTSVCSRTRAHLRPMAPVLDAPEKPSKRNNEKT